FSSRRQHTRSYGDWSSDVCSSDLKPVEPPPAPETAIAPPAPRNAASAHSRSTPPPPDGKPSCLSRGRLQPANRRFAALPTTLGRSEERRVGKECSTVWVV